MGITLHLCGCWLPGEAVSLQQGLDAQGDICRRCAIVPPHACTVPQGAGASLCRVPPKSANGKVRLFCRVFHGARVLWCAPRAYRSRPRTHGELALVGLSLAAGGGHNAGSSNGCFPWEFQELTSAMQEDFPDQHKSYFANFSAGFILQYKCHHSGPILEERIVVAMEAPQPDDNPEDSAAGSSTDWPDQFKAASGRGRVAGCSLSMCTLPSCPTGRVCFKLPGIASLVVKAGEGIEHVVNASLRPRMMRCGTCKRAYYCSAECQRQDWERHKNECKPPSPAQNLLNDFVNAKLAKRDNHGALRRLAYAWLGAEFKAETWLGIRLVRPVDKLATELNMMLQCLKRIR